MAKPLHVLLFSPVAGRDPASGDTSYTASLLASPPSGVTYTTYARAISNGSLRLRGGKPRRGQRWRPTDAGILGLRTVELGLRSAGFMFREPWWFVEISADYDLVHQHLFAVRQLGHRLPVVSSAGYPLGELYRNREGWSAEKASRAEKLELIGARALRVHTPWLHGVAPAIMTAYSHAAIDHIIERGWCRHNTAVVSTGLEQMGKQRRRSDGRHIVFIGRDFDLKGGPEALAAFDLLRERGLNVRMTVVTSALSAPNPLNPDVRWILDADRVLVTNDLLPTADILLAPTRSDCGAPYGVLEALQRGVAVILSSSRWLDTRLVEPGVVRADPAPEALADAVQELLMPTKLAVAQSAAQALWASTFSAEMLGQDLRAVYDRALVSAVVA